MADLRLDVKDPEGPVPVGADASYELHVRNRGTKAAENVEVLVYFSNGVEPISADGQPNRLSPGQVVFDQIPAIPPATELVLKVRAKAALAGNHVFRAEVHCKTIGTRLVREEVTHFYQDGPSLQQATSAPAAAPVVNEPRTAEREAPLPLPQAGAARCCPRRRLNGRSLLPGGTDPRQRETHNFGRVFPLSWQPTHSLMIAISANDVCKPNTNQHIRREKTRQASLPAEGTYGRVSSGCNRA